jgi:hypothetical protein
MRDRMVKSWSARPRRNRRWPTSTNRPASERLNSHRTISPPSATPG